MAQLRAAGLSQSAVTRLVASGHLHRVYRGVYAVGHAGLSREGRFLAAVLWAGEGAALSHLAAAELRRLRRYRAPLIDVVVRTRRRAPRGVRVHETRALDARDVTTYKGIPVTTVPRMLVDLSDVLTAHELANVIHEAAFKGWFSEPATRDAILRANGRRNLRVLDTALQLNAAGSAGVRSRPEAAFLQRLTTVPEPLVNTKLQGVEADFRWPEARLAVEIDGPQHGRPRTKQQDAAKQAVLEAAGYTVLRFGDHELDRAAAETKSRLQAAACSRQSSCRRQ